MLKKQNNNSYLLQHLALEFEPIMSLKKLVTVQTVK